METESKRETEKAIPEQPYKLFAFPAESNFSGVQYRLGGSLSVCVRVTVPAEVSFLFSLPLSI